MKELELPVSFREFLEKTPPGQESLITDLGTDLVYIGGQPSSATLGAPNIELYCKSDLCSGPRLFRGMSDTKLIQGKFRDVFLSYVCKNCTSTSKTFALRLTLLSDSQSGKAVKFGEMPPFGPPTPSRLIKLIGPEKDLFLKGRRAENQGLGIAAFAYYRRVIEDQKDRIFDEIIKVCQRLKVEQELIDELTEAKKETQFSKAVDSIKHGIPQALLIDGHNPLTLLHGPLSEGLHALTDTECLELATSIREVMVELAERMGQALKDEATLSSAVSRLLQKKTFVAEKRQKEI